MSTDYVGSTLVYTVSGLVVVGIPYAWKHRHDVKKRQTDIADAVSELTTALVGVKPTELNPHPPQGLISKVDFNSEATLAMSVRLSQTADTVAALSEAQLAANGTSKRIEAKVDAQRTQLTALVGVPIAVTLPEIKTAVGVSTTEIRHAVDEHDERALDKQTEILEAIKDAK